MELRHLRYFIKAAELMNFTKAAEALYVSQPTLSVQIHQVTVGALWMHLSPAAKAFLELVSERSKSLSSSISKSGRK